MKNYFEEFNIPTDLVEKVDLPFYMYGKQNGKLNEKFITYIIATQAKKAFSKLIVDVDKNLEFHSEVPDFEKDPEEVKKALQKYQPNKNQFETLIKEWKENNKDLFTKIPYIPSVSIYASGFELKGNFTVEEAIQGYKLASAMSNFITKNKDDLQISFKNMIKPEYSDEYKSIIDEYRAAVGFPTESEIISDVTKEVPIIRTRLKLNRKPYENKDPFIKYANEYANYLINLDPDSLNKNDEFEEE